VAKIHAGRVLQKIPNQNIYAVITDFADKRYGESSVVIGARVTDKSQVPAGLVLKTIPAKPAGGTSRRREVESLLAWSSRVDRSAYPRTIDGTSRNLGHS